MNRLRRVSAFLVLILASVHQARASNTPDLATCKELLVRAPDEESPAECLFEVATKAGPSQETAARQLEELAEERPESLWFAIYLGNLKRQTRDHRQVLAAEKLYRQSAAVASRRGLPDAEFEALRGLCRILRDAGDLDEAGSLTEQAVRTAEASGDSLLRSRATILQAMYWTAQGEVARAYSALSGIQEAVEAEHDYRLYREYFFELAKVAQQTGQLHEARAAYDRFADLAAARGDLYWEAQARYGSSAVLLDEISEMPREGDRDKLLELARRALDVARAARIPSAEVQSLRMLGSLEDDLETAQEHLERCFQVALTPWEKSYCRSALARRLANTDPERAGEAMREARSLALASGNALAWTAFWHEQMHVSWALHSPKIALEDSRTALDAIEALRDQQGGSASQPGLFSTWAEDYYWLSGQLLEAGEAGDDERAFQVIERMRARTLSDAIGVARTDSRLSPGPRASGFASLEQVRRTLAPDEAFLSFQVAPSHDLLGEFGGGSWLFVLTRSTPPRVYSLPDRIDLRPKVDSFIGMFESRDDSEADGSVALYEMLLRQGLDALPAGIRRLVIVSDDALHRLPFAALRRESSPELLTSRYEIATVPSATLWLHLRHEQPGPATAPAIVLAAPPPTKPGTTAERAAAFPGETDLGELPRAREEGRSVVRHLGGGSVLWEDEEASEAALKQIETGRFSVVHFATHSFTDDVEPERSYVYLAPGSPQQDGRLEVREIVNLDFQGRIVVLSSCESASGEILRGEGVMSLARAFFQAGASTVVASLWKLRDDDGAELFDRFYEHIGEGKSVSAALQEAQRDRMAAGAPAEAWAGVVVLGDGNRVPLPGGRKGHGRELLVAVAVIGLLAGAALFLWWRGGAKARVLG
jgi:tetratricopeptide (TPR) repeat protein